MRTDVGLATLPQRIAAITSLTATTRPTAAGGAGFADALAEQVQAQTPTAAPTALGATGVGIAPSLGPGVQLSGTGLISPQLPGTAGAAGGVAPAEGTGGTPGPARTGPPPELQAYGNGQVPASALQSLGTGDHMLWSPAARAFRDMMAAAAADGVSMGINSSYRDLAKQQEMVDRYGLYSQGGRAAAPGTSNHGWGVSVDLQLDDRAQAWMRENGSRFGFVEDVPREPWHWTFTASSY